MKQSFSTGISKTTYALPKNSLSIDVLEKNLLIKSSSETLKKFGFSHCYITENSQELHSLLLDSAKKIIESLPNPLNPEKDIEAVIYYSGISFNEQYPKTENVLDLFTYPISQIQHDLNLKNIPVYTLSQQGCSGLFSSFELADKLLTHSSKKYVLCLTADRLPTNKNREIIYNVISDAASATLIEKNIQHDKIISSLQLSNHSYWNTPLLENEILAMYFPMAERTIRTLLEKADITIDELTWIVPHNVSIRSWEILAKLLNFPINKIWAKNIGRIGHTVSCDHIINISDMKEEGLFKKGDKLLLFTFGFGTHWSSMIIEH